VTHRATRIDKKLATGLVACVVALAATPTAAAASAHRAPCLPGDPQSPSCLVWTGKVTFVDDGDTVDVKIDGGSTRRVRVTGINTAELTRYSHKASKRRGACHAVAATNQLERMIRKSHWRVRLLAQHASSHSGHHRIRRSLQLRIGGRWQDPGAVQLRTGLALWLPNQQETAWNRSYRSMALSAAARGVGIYDSSSCGRGPAAGAQLRVHVNWNAAGDDRVNVNGEWIEVRNLGARPVHVGHWRVKDSDLKHYTLPGWATVPAHGSIYVHVGRGRARGTNFYWGLGHALFDGTIGDGGYLYDPQGDLRAWDIYTP
jgi:endonuclease YncB( thermonuclease family)